MLTEFRTSGRSHDSCLSLVVFQSAYGRIVSSHGTFLSHQRIHEREPKRQSLRPASVDQPRTILGRPSFPLHTQPSMKSRQNDLDGAVTFSRPSPILREGRAVGSHKDRIAQSDHKTRRCEDRASPLEGGALAGRASDSIRKKTDRSRATRD